MNKLFFKYLIELWQYIETKRRKQFFFIFFLMLLASISELISIGAIIPFLSVITSPDILYSNVHLKPLIQFLQIKNSQDLILPITILFALTATISGIIRLLLLWAQTKFAYGLVADFSINIYRRTLYQPYFIHISRNSSDIISGITSKSSYLTHQCIVPLITIISSGLILLSIMSLLVIIDPYMAISTFFGFGCIYLILSIVTKNKLIQASEVINSDTSLVIKTLQEGLGGIRDILIDGSQETYLNHFKKAEIRLRNALSKVSNISASPRFGIESLGMVMISIVAYLLAKRQEGLTSAIPLLGVLAMGAQRLLPLLQQVYGSLTTMRGSMASLRETLFLLKQPLPQELNNSKIHNINFNKQIKLNNVTFKYGNNLPIILNEINMIFTKGSRIGFIGSTGSGKSTLLDIIMGLLEPTSGFLEIDGYVQSDGANKKWAN